MGADDATHDGICSGLTEGLHSTQAGHKARHVLVVDPCTVTRGSAGAQLRDKHGDRAETAM